MEEIDRAKEMLERFGYVVEGKIKRYWKLIVIASGCFIVGVFVGTV